MWFRPPTAPSLSSAPARRCVVLPTAEQRWVLGDALTLVSSRCDLEHDHQEDWPLGGLIGRTKKAKNKTRCMGQRNSIPDELRGEGHRLIAEAYVRLRVAGTGHVRPEECNSLDEFQAAFAAADEWQAFGLIEVLEDQRDREDGWLIHPIQFRRLK